MREIKFRGIVTGGDFAARRKPEMVGKWVYGYLDIDRCGYATIGIDEGDWYDGPFNMQYEVNAATIGQYTGLNDKNGKEIYEGDIVRFGDDRWAQTVEVKYGQFEIDCCGCCYKSHVALGFNIPSGHQYVGEIESGEYEVIGNIHEK